MSDDEAFLSIKAVCAMLCLAPATIARLEAEKRFPRRIPVPGKDGKIWPTSRRVFLRSEVMAYMRSLIEAARGSDVPESDDDHSED